LIKNVECLASVGDAKHADVFDQSAADERGIAVRAIQANHRSDKEIK